MERQVRVCDTSLSTPNGPTFLKSLDLALEDRGCPRISGLSFKAWTVTWFCFENTVPINDMSLHCRSYRKICGISRSFLLHRTLLTLYLAVSPSTRPWDDWGHSCSSPALQLIKFTGVELLRKRRWAHLADFPEPPTFPLSFWVILENSSGQSRKATHSCVDCVQLCLCLAIINQFCSEHSCACRPFWAQGSIPDEMVSRKQRWRPRAHNTFGNGGCPPAALAWDGLGPQAISLIDIPNQPVGPC